MKLSDRMILGLEQTKPTKIKYYKTVLIYNKRTLCDVNSAGEIFKVQTSITLIDCVNKPTRAKVELFVKVNDIIRIDHGRVGQ